jgi:hypothetical protein
MISKKECGFVVDGFEPSANFAVPIEQPVTAERAGAAKNAAIQTASAG